MNILKAIVWFLEIKHAFTQRRMLIVKKQQRNIRVFFNQASKKISQAFEHKHLWILVSALIFLISIYTQSTRDIGHYSATYIGMAGFIFFGKLLNIDQIIAQQVCSNFIGIIALFFTSKILQRTKIYQQRIYYNIILISCAIGYFLRIYSINYNEFGTVDSYLLALLFPYICYQLITAKNLYKSDNIILAIISSTLAIIKPPYALFIIVAETRQAIIKKSIKSIFCLRNYLTLVLIITSLIINPSSSLQINSDNLHQLLLLLLNHISPILILFLIYYLRFRNFAVSNQTISIFVLFSLSYIACLSLHKVEGLNDISLFYSLATAAVALISYEIISEKKKLSNAYWFYFITISLIAFANPQDLNEILADISLFWWFFAIFIALKHKKYLLNKSDRSIIEKIIIPKKSKEWVAFTVTAMMFIFASNQIKLYFLQPLSLILFANLVVTDQLYSKQNNFPKLYIITLFSIIINLVGLTKSSIINSGDNFINSLQSPLERQDQIAKNILSYSDQKNVTFISNDIYDQYPITKYLDINSNLHKQNLDTNLKLLLQEISDNKNDLIITKNYDFFTMKNCHISSLELSLRNSAFREIFINNYKFQNRILIHKPQKPQIRFFSEDKKYSKDLKNSIRVYYDYEVYRKI